MRLMAWPLLALLLIGGALYAQEGLNVDVVAVTDGKATPGSEYTLKLRFTVPEGYHSYHKDNRDKGGYGVEPLVQWQELSGLELLRAAWPEAKEYTVDGITEFVYYGTFEIAYTFRVPASASGTLSVAGTHETQFCDADGCLIGDGKFQASIEVAGSAEPAMPTTTTSAAFAAPAAPGGEAEFKLTFTPPAGWHAYHKDTATHGGYGVPPRVKFRELSGLTLKEEQWPEAALVVYADDWAELEYKDTFTLTYVFEVPADAAGTLTLSGSYDIQVCDDVCIDNSGTFSAALSIAEPEPQLDPARVDSHGFYLDFDYALEQARTLGKPLLVDFNGVNCPPCRRMERTVFTLPEVKKLFEEYVIVSLLTDVRDARANELFAKYRPADVFGPPYYAVLNHEGERVRGIGSTLPANERAHEFIAFLKGEEVTRGSLPPAGPDRPDEAPAQKPANWPEGLPAGPLPHIERGFEFEAKFSAPKVKPGAEVTLELHFRLKRNDAGEEYYLYHKDTEFGTPLLIDVKGHEGVTPAGEWEYPTPKRVVEEGIGTMLELTGHVVLVQRFKVPADAAPATIRVFGTAAGQYCDSGGCIQFDRVSLDSMDRHFGWVAEIAISPDGIDSAIFEPEESDDSAFDRQVAEAGGLLWFLFFALLGGMVALLTPCVLPVIPLTIGFFVGQAEKGKSSLLTAAIYCACIVGSFTALGLITSLLIGASGAQDLATNGWVNSFLGLLFLVFALSFLGMFELRAPGFMTAWFNRKQMAAQKEGHGYAKAFFSGTAFALISFSCTVPIAGAFLAGAAAGSIWLPTLAMLAFSAGMAVPIFIMGQFPAMMKKLPKSGGWMNALKVVFGFVELGLAIMYFSAAEQAFASLQAAEWISRYVVLAVWIAASIATGLYLLGVFRMPHDHEKTEQVGVIRAIFAVAFLSFALYLLPGMFGAQFGKMLEGILPLPPAEGGIQLGFSETTKNNPKDLPWERDLARGLETSAEVNKPVFIDFTGFN